MFSIDKHVFENHWIVYLAGDAAAVYTPVYGIWYIWYPACPYNQTQVLRTTKNIEFMAMECMAETTPYAHEHVSQIEYGLYNDLVGKNRTTDLDRERQSTF